MIVVYEDGHGSSVPDDYALTPEDGTKSALVSDELWNYYAHTKYGVGWEIKYHKFIQLEPLETVKGYISSLESILLLEEYLADTDYIITKIQEAQVEYPEEVEELRTRYATELENRRTARAGINQLQQEYAKFY